MMEGCSFGQSIGEPGRAISNLPRLPNCVIGIDIFAIYLETQILWSFEYPRCSDLGHERRSVDEKRRGQEQNSVVGSWALGDFGRPVEYCRRCLDLLAPASRLEPGPTISEGSVALPIGASTDSAAFNKLTAFVSSSINGQIGFEQFEKIRLPNCLVIT